ncbi:3'(2'),5'-bisphosphate nucleotidase CysQ [Devosia sp. SL43]|uniref:3'(2'),5'-bisphosphate nucleotidase CysQ n=1 Tax=Devosia sp. SL43 TaxID=2806348 RepID=UPI001F02F920|nr:3'(2'),5'-bisphosphate nucleotidase CysQ [Devosia sp. SL43]UJW86431.1 3'(2'),5'-bisphosphate nucleotidase CysQ [Devosia sp. SL43]
MVIEELLAVAIAAGAEILRIYDTDFAVRVKDDSSPVTEADEAAEAIIVEALGRLAPDVAIVAEEAASAGQIPATDKSFFLVDPLDGSKEFITRNGEFTVNIGLIEDGAPVLGVVYAPALGRIWWGARESGAFHGRVLGRAISDSQPIRVRGSAGTGLDVVGSRSHGGSDVDGWLQRFQVSRFIAAGSSLKFCLVASGEADLYPRLGRTMEWDTAAGDAILRAAGGRVETLLGDLLCYGKRNQAHDTDFANPHFVAFGDPALA